MQEIKLNNLEINELTEEQYKTAKESGVLNPDAFYMTPGTKNITETTPISKGGTDATSASEARVNLGFEYGEEIPSHIPATGDGAVYFRTTEENGPLPITEGGTGAITVEEIHTNLGQADYVIEQGIDGIWTYRKWNSGIAECWGSDTTSSSAGSAEGNVYWSRSNTYSFPGSLFIAAPTVDISVGCGTSYLTWASINTLTKDAVAWYYVHDTSTAKSTIYNNITAKGRWK